MINKIGERIKELRKKSDITQERLADYIGITYQAVSRWESGICYPDLELLPLVANIFNVTTDYLLGVDTTKKQLKIAEYEKESFAAGQVGDGESAINAWRKALNEFPNDYYVMCNLAYSLHFYYLERDDASEYYDEALEIGEKVFNECTDEKIHHDIIRLLVQLYKYKGEDKAARTLAERMPDIYACSDMLLSHVLDGEELINHERHNIDIFMFFIKPALFKISDDNKYSINEKIEILQLYLRLLETIYAEDSEEIKKRECETYYTIAKLYAELNDTDNTLIYLGKLKHHSIENMINPIYDNYEMKSILFKGEIRQDEYITTDSDNSAMQALKNINTCMEFDFIRSDTRFISIVTEIEQYAKK